MNIYVGNISRTATEQDLKEAFEGFGDGRAWYPAPGDMPPILDSRLLSRYPRFETERVDSVPDAGGFNSCGIWKLLDMFN